MYLIYTLVEPHTYRKWEPIDTGKFGFDVVYAQAPDHPYRLWE